MEKLKWILLAVLLIVLVIVVFYNPKKQSDVRSQNNTAVIRIEHTEINADLTPSKKIEEGEYILNLEEFQVIEGKGEGVYLRFSLPINDREMIMTFDIVDTTGDIFRDIFPLRISQKVSGSNDSAGIGKLFRGSFNTGYFYHVKNNRYQEDVIPMPDFSCRIDTMWFSDSLGGIRMNFSATHSEFLVLVYGMRYILTGSVDISDAKITRRIIQ
jgi:hypothetical protein